MGQGPIKEEPPWGPDYAPAPRRPPPPTPSANPPGHTLRYGKPKRFEIEMNDDYSVMGGASLTWRHYAAAWIIAGAIALTVVLWQLSSLKF